MSVPLRPANVKHKYLAFIYVVQRCIVSRKDPFGIFSCPIQRTLCCWVCACSCATSLNGSEYADPSSIRLALVFRIDPFRNLTLSKPAKFTLYTFLRNEFFLRDPSRLHSHFSPFYRNMYKYIVCYVAGAREMSATTRP